MNDNMNEDFFKAILGEDGFNMDSFNEKYDNTNKSNLMKLQINYINKSTNPNPEYGTDGASGFDLRANIGETITLKPLERTLIPTGLFFELPPFTEIQVRPRSGLAIKNGVTVLNTPGTVDSDYRGEIKVILINLGSEDFTISHGDRIAQAIISQVMGQLVYDLNIVDSIDLDTSRNDNGFGSTGIK